MRYSLELNNTESGAKISDFDSWLFHLLIVTLCNLLISLYLDFPIRKGEIKKSSYIWDSLLGFNKITQAKPSHYCLPKFGLNKY